MTSFRKSLACELCPRLKLYISSPRCYGSVSQSQSNSPQESCGLPHNTPAPPARNRAPFSWQIYQGHFPNRMSQVSHPVLPYPACERKGKWGWSTNTTALNREASKSSGELSRVLAHSVICNIFRPWREVADRLMNGLLDMITKGKYTGHYIQGPLKLLLQTLFSCLVVCVVTYTHVIPNSQCLFMITWLASEGWPR